MANDNPLEITELAKRVEDAYGRIGPHVNKTPLMFSQSLSRDTTANIFLKLESEQITGSFKIRGAFNKILLLKEQNPHTLPKGLVTASTGNHGIACIHAAKTCGCSVEIFCQENISKSKLETLLSYEASISQFGKDCVDAEIKARQTAEERDQIYLSPYNDLDVMAGQGTVGYEIYNQLPIVEYVLVAVGGGGLVGGIAAYLKWKNPKIQIIGCQPKNSKVIYESVKAGHIVHEESYQTLSDATAGDIEDGSVTFPVCNKYVDDWILVDEKQISDAIFYVLDKHHKLIEGSAGVAIAALQEEKEKFKGKNVVIVVCGANVSPSLINQIINEHTNKQ